MINPTFNNIIQVVEYFSENERCVSYLRNMRWADGIVRCPFCDHDKIYELQGKCKAYKCSACRDKFSITKGTIFENSTLPLRKWFIAIYVLTQHNKGISSVGLAEFIGVTQKTAWFMMHRIRKMFEVNETPQMSGIVQVDETYVGGNNKNRHWEKKKESTQGRSGADKTVVIAMVGQKGTVRAEVAADASGDSLLPFIYKNTTGTAIIVTDEWRGYNNVAAINNHVRLNHSAGEHSRGVFHNNSVEGFFSIMKRGIQGIPHWVSSKHMQRYCDEYAFRHNTRNYTQDGVFRLSFKNVNRRLSYLELIGQQKVVKTA